MKREARVVATACEGEVCAAVVVRLDSIDGVALSTRGCDGLCGRLRETGYMDEARYWLGPCRCGPHEVPGEFVRLYRWALEFADRIVRGLAEVLGQRSTLLTCSQGPISGAGVPEPGQRGRA
ncbi:MAG: hypothetical protein ACP5FT_03495 [Acidilobus sp.]